MNHAYIHEGELVTVRQEWPELVGGFCSGIKRCFKSECAGAVTRQWAISGRARALKQYWKCPKMATAFHTTYPLLNQQTQKQMNSLDHPAVYRTTTVAGTDVNSSGCYFKMFPVLPRSLYQAQQSLVNCSALLCTCSVCQQLTNKIYTNTHHENGTMWERTWMYIQSRIIWLAKVSPYALQLPVCR